MPEDVPLPMTTRGTLECVGAASYADVARKSPGHGDPDLGIADGSIADRRLI